jgi:hypothetical protein
MRVLFTGYAPVHFLCFKPLYERLIRMPGVEVSLSGGVRQRSEQGRSFDTAALYRPLGVPDSAMLSVPEIKEREFDLLFCANTKALKPARVGQTIQIFHGMSFRNLAIREDNLGYDHYFVLGPYMLRGFAERGLLASDDPRVAKIGFMKTDRLLDGSLDRASLLRQFGLSGERPILVYAPTGEKRNSMERMGEELIQLVERSGKYDLIIKPHDHSHDGIDWFERLAPYESERVKLTRELDVIPCLFLADLLISDASSVSNEYALLDRPMLFLDVPKLIQTAREKGSMVDLQTWGRRGGLVAPDAPSALDAIAYALAAPKLQSPVRQAMAEDLFYNPGHATDAALAWLRDELGLGRGAESTAPVRASA